MLTQYLPEMVQQGLDNVVDNGEDLSAQIALTNRIVSLIQNTTKDTDLMETYENPIEYACDVQEGKYGLPMDGKTGGNVHRGRRKLDHLASSSKAGLNRFKIRVVVLKNHSLSIFSAIRVTQEKFWLASVTEIMVFVSICIGSSSCFYYTKI